MDFWLTLLIQLGVLAVALYFYFRQKFTYWSSRGIPGPSPGLLSMGNTFQILGNPPDSIEVELAAKYGTLYGYYYGFTRGLTISDPELIKQILIKDFHHFVERRSLGTYHKLWNHNLFFAESEEWKRIRTIVSPSFTSGKLRKMYPLMNGCIAKLITFFQKQTAQSGEAVINTKEVISGFTFDVIASAGFATETNANHERSEMSPFVRNGLGIFEFPIFKLLGLLVAPRWLNGALGIDVPFRESNWQFFVNLTQSIVRQRRASGGATKRNDLVQLLVDAYVYEGELSTVNYEKLSGDYEGTDETPPQAQNGNSTKRSLTEDEIVAQCIFFFFAGFETSASTLSNLIYEMAMNPAIQERLHEEIAENLAGLEVNSEAYYEKVMTAMPFIDAVLKETQRKYPPVPRLERQCSVDNYRLGGAPLSKGDLVEVSVMATHHNPAYYPQPERFNPERFLPENKHLLVPYTYLPFGLGPRNCVGMRFAFQEIRLFIAQLFGQFKFSPAPGTPEKLSFKVFKPLLNVEAFPIKVERW